jgi:hypothetical protein
MSIQNYIDLMEQNRSSMDAQLKQFSLQAVAHFPSVEYGDISCLMTHGMYAHVQGAIQNVNALSAVENPFNKTSSSQFSNCGDDVIEGEAVVINEQSRG